MEKERRFLSEKIEIRKDENGAESRTVRGYAAVFEKESDTLGNGQSAFVERVQRGAFDDADQSDIVCLFNHDPNFILGRSRNGSGTMKTGIDERGLWYELDLPNTTTGNDLLESLKRGDVQSSSFAFSIAKGGDSWVHESRDSGNILVRTISKISRIYDASLVVNPAYPDATVALRSLEKFQAEQEKPEPTDDHSLSHWQRRMGLIDKPASNQTNEK